MFFIGVCRLIGRVLSVACGMYRYVFYRCVSGAWEIAAGSLWDVSVCFASAARQLLIPCVGLPSIGRSMDTPWKMGTNSGPEAPAVAGFSSVP